jgi:ribosomal protein L19E
MAETFVEIPRFSGTGYNAANWICLGETKGRGKLDRLHKARLPKKTIWIYPLARNYRKLLCE